MQTIMLRPTKKGGVITQNSRREYSVRKNKKFIAEQLFKLSEVIKKRSQSDYRRLADGQEFKNEVFKMLPYTEGCGCGAWKTDCVHTVDCRTEIPNFKCGDVEIRWYKHIGRAMNSNRVVTLDELKEIFQKCMKSLK